MSTDEIKFIKCESEQRVDKVISEKLNISRSFVENLIAEGRVRKNGIVIVKKSEIVKKGDVLEIVIPPQRTFTLDKSDIQIEIIYEDNDYLVINKPAGIPVHPTPHHTSKTIVNILMGSSTLSEWQLSKEFSYEDAVKGRVRPGIVHRLDKDVSGVLIIAKNESALTKASEQFKKRLVRKTYIALCFGTKKEEWSVDKAIGRARTQDKAMWVCEKDTKGKQALTLFKSVAVNPEFGLSLIQANPITGRTHQIRVHLCWSGLPIVNDEMYGGGGKKLRELEQKILKKFGENLLTFDGIFLHALELEIFDKKFIAKLPPHFEKIIRLLWPALPPTYS